MALLSDFLAGSRGGDAMWGSMSINAVEGSWPELLPWGQLRTQSPSKTQLFPHSLQESREQAQLAGFTARPTEEAGESEQSALKPAYPP